MNRDSVCMGDDPSNHSICLTLDDEQTYEDLFYMLKEKDYFPHVVKNNVVWVLTSINYECIFSYFTKTNKLSMGLSEHSLKELGHDCFDFYLRYYSSPEKWKEQMIHMYHNDMYSLWRDGWLEEINYCDRLGSIDN